MRQRNQARAGRDVSGSGDPDGVQRGELMAALMGQHEQLFCSLDTDGGPGMGGAGPHGIQAWRPAGAPGQEHTFRAGEHTRFNLLGWDGRGDAPHLFPERGAP